jgi:hypothetical protein
MRQTPQKKVDEEKTKEVNEKNQILFSFSSNPSNPPDYSELKTKSVIISLN